MARGLGTHSNPPPQPSSITSSTRTRSNPTLGNLGRSPSSLHGRNHTFLDFTFRHAKINDVAILKGYPLLMTVDVSYNAVPSLAALSAMPYLWKVAASRYGFYSSFHFSTSSSVHALRPPPPQY